MSCMPAGLSACHHTAHAIISFVPGSCFACRGSDPYSEKIFCSERAQHLNFGDVVAVPILTPTLAMTGYVLGPVTGDHWFVYIADKCDRPDFTATDRTVRHHCSL